METLIVPELEVSEEGRQPPAPTAAECSARLPGEGVEAFCPGHPPPVVIPGPPAAQGAQFRGVRSAGPCVLTTPSDSWP